MRYFTISFLIFLAGLASGVQSKRNFIGVNNQVQQVEVYPKTDSTELIFYDNFNDEKLDPAWKKQGNIDFFERKKLLKARMRSRKRHALSGSMICEKTFNAKKQPVLLQLEQTIPSKNPTLSSAVYFYPADAAFDAQGFPKTYIRYLKRSQIELIESKREGDRSKLIWGRNQPVDPGTVRSICISLDSRRLSLSINGTSLYDGKHNVDGLDALRAGLWVSTKGTSYAGGLMSFDNFILERVTSGSE